MLPLDLECLSKMVYLKDSMMFTKMKRIKEEKCFFNNVRESRLCLKYYPELEVHNINDPILIDLSEKEAEKYDSITGLLENHNCKSDV